MKLKVYFGKNPASCYASFETPGTEIVLTPFAVIVREPNHCVREIEKSENEHVTIRLEE